MSYIGNTSTTQAFTPAIDYFSGNGSTTAFTLSRPVASVAQVQVTIDNVAQNPSSAYTVSANTITFTSAPLSGTNNIYVYYTSPITQVIAPGQGTAGINALDVYGGVGTAAMNLPSGTTAQRPGTPVAGAIRYNSTTGLSEVYQNSTWQSFQPSGTSTGYIVEALIVGGGGGTAGESGGGGGGGGVINVLFTATIGTVYTMTVGSGGASRSAGSVSSIAGSGLTTITAIGGGIGGGNSLASGDGGSGGGGAWLNYLPGVASKTNNINIGSMGGLNLYSAVRHGAGGGGAGKVGQPTTSTDDKFNGAGGDGLPFNVWCTATSTGSDGYLGGGGGGGGEYYNAVPNSKTVSSIGGAGGGGSGCYGGTAGTGGTTGAANTGGGGGGQCGNTSAGLAGGSGVVIIRYLGAQRGTGGTVTTLNGYTYHKYASTSTYTA